MKKNISMRKSMRYFIFVAALASFFLLFYRTPVASSQRAYQSYPRPLLLMYQKTPCSGSCPAFDARIYSDGRVVLKAVAHVPFTDTLQGQLTRKELKRLKRDLRHLPYKGWRTTYLSQHTDQPATVITFYEEDDEIISIRHQEGGPSDLLIFQKKMDALLMGVIARSMQKRDLP